MYFLLFMEAMLVARPSLTAIVDQALPVVTHNGSQMHDMVRARRS